MNQAAIELDVNERTIRNYENGAVRIPYSAFRLVRLLAGYSLVNTHWEGWGFHANKLWTPEGRSFEAYELRYLATYISIARHSIKNHQAKPQERSTYGAATNLAVNNSPLASGEPSSATALFGVEVRQVNSLEFEIPLSLQEKAA